MYQPTDNVTSEADIRAVIPDTFESQEAKILDHLDPLCTAWIKNRPFSRWPKSTKTVAAMCPPKAIRLDLCGFSMTKRWRSQIGPATTVMTDFSTSCPPVVSGSSFFPESQRSRARESQRFGRARSRTARQSCRQRACSRFCGARRCRRSVPSLRQSHHPIKAVGKR